jgi:hypothetical protein
VGEERWQATEEGAAMEGTTSFVCLCHHLFVRVIVNINAPVPEKEGRKKEGRKREGRKEGGI